MACETCKVDKNIIIGTCNAGLRIVATGNTSDILVIVGHAVTGR